MPPAAPPCDSPTTCDDDGDAEGARAAKHGLEAEAEADVCLPAPSAAPARECWPPPLRLDDAVALRERSAAIFDALVTASDVKYGRLHPHDEELARVEQLLESSAPKARVALDHAPPPATTAATVKIVWTTVKIYDIPSTAATEEPNKIVYSMNDTTNEFYDIEKHYAASTAAPVRAIGLQPLGLSACAARADPSDPVVARRTSTRGALTVSYQMLRDT